MFLDLEGHELKKGYFMSLKKILKSKEGKIGYILLWAIGVPVPILLGIFFLRGCN